MRHALSLLLLMLLPFPAEASTAICARVADPAIQAQCYAQSAPAGAGGRRSSARRAGGGRAAAQHGRMGGFGYLKRRSDGRVSITLPPP